MEKKKGKVVLPEEALVKVLARSSSLRSIARFRSVCKRWKSIIDSDFFRDIYESLNTCSSLSWPITNNRNRTLSHETVGHHGCKRWGLTKSMGSWMMRYEPETTVRKVSVLSCASGGLVSLYTETSDGAPMYHVGNPLLQQWDRIPLPPHLSAYDVARLHEKRFVLNDNGLVTKMEKGIVVGYKVVWTLPSFYGSKVGTHFDGIFLRNWCGKNLRLLVGLGADFFPVVMHPLYSYIMYMWSRNTNGLVEINLTTRKYRLHTEESEENNKCMDGYILRLSGCKEYMDSIYLAYSIPYAVVLTVSTFHSTCSHAG